MHPLHSYLKECEFQMPNILPTPDAANLVNFSCSVLCLLAQLCPTLCDPMDHSLPGSFVHGDSPGKNTGVGSHAHLQGSSQPKDRTQVSHISGRFFTIWATREAKNTRMGNLSLLHGNFLTQEWKRGLLHFWWILHQLSYQGYSLWGHEELDFTEQLTLSWGELCPPKKMC